MRKLIFLPSILFIFSCGSGDDDSTQPLPPEAALLTAPDNNKVCETGTSISDSKSNVDFSWSASANTTSYDLKITKRLRLFLLPIGSKMIYSDSLSTSAVFFKVKENCDPISGWLSTNISS